MADIKLHSELQKFLDGRKLDLEDCAKPWQKKVMDFQNKYENESLTKDQVEARINFLVEDFYNYHKKSDNSIFKNEIVDKHKEELEQEKAKLDELTEKHKEEQEQQQTKYEQEMEALRKNNKLIKYQKRVDKVRGDLEQLEKVRKHYERKEYEDIPEILQYIDEKIEVARKLKEKKDAEEQERQKEVEQKQKESSLQSRLQFLYDNRNKEVSKQQLIDAGIEVKDDSGDFEDEITDYKKDGFIIKKIFFQTNYDIEYKQPKEKQEKEAEKEEQAKKKPEEKPKEDKETEENIFNTDDE